MKNLFFPAIHDQIPVRPNAMHLLIVLGMAMFFSCSSVQKLSPDQQNALSADAPDVNISKMLSEHLLPAKEAEPAMVIPPLLMAKEQTTAGVNDTLQIRWSGTCPISWQKKYSIFRQIALSRQNKKTVDCSSAHICAPGVPVLQLDCDKEMALRAQFLQEQPSLKGEIFSLNTIVTNKGARPDFPLLQVTAQKRYAQVQIPTVDSLELEPESNTKISEKLAKFSESEIRIISFAPDLRISISGAEGSANQNPGAALKIPAGVREITVTRAGYKSLKGRLHLKPGDKAEIKISYPDDPQSDPVRLLSLPPNLLVYKNGKFSGFTPRVYDKSEFTQDTEIQLVERKNPKENPEYFEIFKTTFSGQQDKMLVWKKGDTQGSDFLTKGLLQTAQCSLAQSTGSFTENDVQLQFLKFSNEGSCLMFTPLLNSAVQTLEFHILPGKESNAFFFLQIENMVAMLEMRGDSIRFIPPEGYQGENEGWHTLNLFSPDTANSKPAIIQMRYHKAERDAKTSEITEKAFYELSANGKVLGKSVVETNVEPRIGFFVKHANGTTETTVRQLKYHNEKKKFLGLL